MSLIINSFVVYILLLSALTIGTIRIPFIDNAILVPRYLSNFTIVHNRSIGQCLCLSLPWFVTFNWFPNNTCQFFVKFPITYKIQSMSQTRLYFPQRVLPNASHCCMSDTYDLLNKLGNGMITVVNVPSSGNLILDTDGYLVTVEMTPPKLDRFHARNLSLISRTDLNGSFAIAVGFVNNIYFIGYSDGPINLIESRHLTLIGNVTSPFLRGVRGIIFLKQGRTMVVSATNNHTLGFFNQTTTSPPNYVLAYQKYVSYYGLHGLTPYDDTTFYATSWLSNSVYRYTAAQNNPMWDETLVVDGGRVYNTSNGNFVTTDDCGRYWLAFATSMLYVFDSHGVWLGGLNITTGAIYDVLIADDYVMFISDSSPGVGRIIRIDPRIQC